MHYHICTFQDEKRWQLIIKVLLKEIDYSWIIKKLVKLKLEFMFYKRLP